MRLLVLGAGTIFMTPTHTQSGYLLELPGENRFVFDFGPGKMLRLMEAGVSPWEVEHIFLTHFHLDHVADIPPLLFSKIEPGLPKNANLTIYSLPEILEWYEGLKQLYGKMVLPERYELTLRPLEPGENLKIGSALVRPYRMNHSRPAYGYRVEWKGKVFAYSGDTDVCEEVVELGREADLFVLECTLPSTFKVEGHLTPKEAGEIAAKAKCKNLLLTHFYPLLWREKDKIIEEVKQSYSGNLFLAEDMFLWEG